MFQTFSLASGWKTTPLHFNIRLLSFLSARVAFVKTISKTRPKSSPSISSKMPANQLLHEGCPKYLANFKFVKISEKHG